MRAACAYLDMPEHAKPKDTDQDRRHGPADRRGDPEDRRNSDRVIADDDPRRLPDAGDRRKPAS